MLKNVVINGYKFDLLIKRDSYHRIRASFKDKTLIINAYHSVTDEEINDFINKNQKRILKHVLHVLNNTVKDNIKILGETYNIKDSHVNCVDDHTIYTDDRANIKYYCANNFYRKLYEYLKEKTSYYYKIMYKDNNIPTVSVVNVKSYYGQYNRLKHHIKYNVCLMFNDLDVIDSVIVHELSHIKYMNHQKEFYDLVKLVLPNYDCLQEKLKKEGLSL